MSHDNFTTLLVALINALPWAVGLWLARERRMEKAERERQHNSHRHVQHPVKTDGPHYTDEHGKSSAGYSSGDGDD